MKFAHIADIHIGAWRDPALKEMNLQAFIKAIDIVLEEKCDFLLIAGDLFNTALPAVDQLKETIRQLKRLAQAKIPTYYIAGSHDFSPSGKTLLDVLEEVDLATNVTRGTIEGDMLKLKFTIDPKTKVKITGLLGKKGMLDKHYYEALDRKSLEDEPGEKIFMFHTSITELKPENLQQMESYSLTFMPRGFKYYAGGHVHIRKTVSIDGYNNAIYPGPAFPCNFSELEKLEYGSLMIVEDWKPRMVPLKLKPVKTIRLDADGKTPENVSSEIRRTIQKEEMNDSILLLRIEGRLTQGTSADLDNNEIMTIALKQGAYHVLRNTSKLTSEELDETSVGTLSTEEIEERILKEHAGQIKNSWNETETAERLLSTLSQEKYEGEKTSDYEKRLMEDTDTIFNSTQNREA